MGEIELNGEIIVNSDVVGQIEYEKNHLCKIEIHPHHQGMGYGTEAVAEFVKQARSQGFDKVTTTPVTTPAMAHIFQNLGFKKVEDPSRHEFLDDGPENRYLSCYYKTL